MTPPTPDRIAALDIIRGVAVMGILVANLPAFALPEAAYFSPLAAGGTGPADIAVWFVTFVLVEGKMRGLFTFLFGASMLLVIDRATASGQNAAATHYRRMAVLFAIGCAHLYLLWWGDILAHYALIGAIAFMFAGLKPRPLVVIALTTLLLSLLLDSLAVVTVFASAARDTPQAIATWAAFAQSFGIPPAADLAAEIAAMRGDWAGGIAWRWAHAMSPLTALTTFGLETLSATLLGMAAYRSGFLTGAWERTRYRRWAIVCLGIALPAYALLGINTIAHGFDQRWVVFASLFAVAPFRALGFVGYAALLILLVRPGGRLTMRIAATGRVAFTNYLGTTLAMALIFQGWGLGLFATLPRSQLYLLVPVAWLAMLAWSKPWLDRFAYGPLEWLWRSAARMEIQPLRRPTHATNRRR